MMLFKSFTRITTALLFLGFVSSVNAGRTENGEYFNSSENPHENFSIAKLNSEKIEITFITTKNVRAVCDAESKKRGHGGFSYTVEACSFFSSSSYNNTCTIVLPIVTNFHTIGHEVRHCMQGNYHK